MAKEKQPTPAETAAEEKAEAMRQAAATLQAKQTILPTQSDPSLAPIPASKQPGRGRDYRQDTYEYLEAAGWQHVGTNELGVGLWMDPLHDRKAKDAESRFQTITLPVKEGGEPMVVRQAVVPPASWDYTTEQAALTQRQRDHHAKLLAEQVAAAAERQEPVAAGVA